MASQHSSGPLSISVQNNEHTTTTANTSKDNADNDAGNDSSDDDEVKVEVSKTEPLQNAIAQHLAPLTVTPQPQRRRSSVQCQQGSPAPLATLSPASTSNGCVTVSNGGSGIMSPVVTPTSETVGSGRKMSVVTTAAPGGAMPYTQAERDELESKTKTLGSWPKYTTLQWTVRTCVQFIGIVLIGSTVIVPALPVFYALNVALDNLGRFAALALVPVAYAAYILLLLTLIVVWKWLVIGRFKAGEYRLTSVYYLRWWFVDRLYTFVNDRLYGIGILRLWWLKALGLKKTSFTSSTPITSTSSKGSAITADHYIDVYTSSVSEFDLISIGSGTVVYEDVRLRAAVLAGGMLILKPVTIGSNVSIGVGAVSAYDDLRYLCCYCRFRAITA
eukprot:4289-Heterococcus_DN1.PRE.2